MATLKGTVAFLHIIVNTVLWCIPIYLLAIPRALFSRTKFGASLSALMGRAADGWVACNRVMLRVLQIVRIDAHWQLHEPLDRTRWYVVVCNHQSWADILILQDTFLSRIPPIKFFNKSQLIWVPLIGFAMWLLDFPYVRRYSREALAANPSLRLKDQQTTARACEHFKRSPTSVLNFLEGTRFTPQKHELQQSPFRHLLAPKTGGLGYVSSQLGRRIHQTLDVTIFYPGGVPTFWEFLCGRCPAARIEISSCEVPEVIFADPGVSELPASTRDSLRRWVDDLWQRKDRRIGELLGSR